MTAVIISIIMTCAVSPPEVPPQFTSNIEQMAGNTFGKWSTGSLVYDRSHSRLKLYSSNLMGVAPVQWEGTPLAWSNLTQWTVSDGTYYCAGGQCRKLIPADQFNDMFSWVGGSSFSGTTTIRNITTDVWSLFSSTSRLQYYVTPAGIPIRYVANVSSAENPSVWQSTIMDFMTYTPVANPSEFADFNKSEVLHPTRCPPPQDLTPIVIDMYIIHPSLHYNISGQDTADAVGDAAFVCFDTLSNTTSDNTSVVSLYSVEVYPQFGQFKQCFSYNPSVCIGDEPILVGRTGSWGFGEFGGQCTSNNLTGSWYSLPPAGLCVNDSRPTSPDVCTWRIIKKVKTIDSKCLTQRGMLSACSEDVRLPYPKATKIFETAFNEDDPSKGGCPPYSNWGNSLTY